MSSTSTLTTCTPTASAAAWPHCRGAWACISFHPAPAGAARLHLSGITPALGPQSAELALSAAQAAADLGVPVSFDGNYRAQLWAAWNSNPQDILSRLIAHADILFGNHQDIALLLGRDFAGSDDDRRRAAAPPPKPPSRACN
jgi:sugar/nucleoside kinase (ribokinase family)